MVIAVILIGAFFIHYALDAAYRRFWSRGLDARVEFQKEPVTEGKEAKMAVSSTFASGLSYSPKPVVSGWRKYQCFGSVL